MKHELKPSVWHALYRMKAAGFPVDIDYLRDTASPLRIHQSQNCDFFAGLPGLEGCYAIRLPLNVRVAAPVVITRVDLQADWIPGSVRWKAPCKIHTNDVCVHPLLSVAAAENLEKQLLCGRRLNPGTNISGVLLGVVEGKCPFLRRANTLCADLVIEDDLGTSFRYPLSVWQTTIEDWEDWWLQYATAHELSSTSMAVGDGPL